MHRHLTLTIVLMALTAGPAVAAPALPALPDAASQKAKDVLADLAAAGIPRAGQTGEPDLTSPTLPELPDTASQNARDVLADLANEGIPQARGLDGTLTGDLSPVDVTVPEPATLALLLAGGAVCLLRRRRLAVR